MRLDYLCIIVLNCCATSITAGRLASSSHFNVVSPPFVVVARLEITDDGLDVYCLHFFLMRLEYHERVEACLLHAGPQAVFTLDIDLNERSVAALLAGIGIGIDI